MAQAYFEDDNFNPYGGSDPYAPAPQTSNPYSTQADWDRASNTLNSFVDNMGPGKQAINWEAARSAFDRNVASGQGNFGDWVNRTFDQRDSWLTGPTNNAAAAAARSSQGYNAGRGTGNPQQDWASLIAGLPPTAQSIAQIFPQFAAMYPGSTFEKGDIKGPWGWADVIGNMDSGNGKWQWYTGSGTPKNSYTGGVGSQMFTDPATKMFQSQILDRLDALMKGVKRPDDDRYRAAALGRVDELTKQAPYTAAEEQALITQMREPLTQARDTRQTLMKEIMGGRNIGPTSGLFMDQVYNTPERDYERALAGGTNDLAVRAVDERQKRKTEAIDILANLVGLGKDERGEDEGRAREVLTTGAILPELSERRLKLLMETMGMGSGDTGSLMSTLTNLMSNNQQQSNFQAGQSQNNAAQWGQILGMLVNSPLLNR